MCERTAVKTLLTTEDNTRQVRYWSTYSLYMNIGLNLCHNLNNVVTIVTAPPHECIKSIQIMRWHSIDSIDN